MVRKSKTDKILGIYIKFYKGYVVNKSDVDDRKHKGILMNLGASLVTIP